MQVATQPLFKFNAWPAAAPPPAGDAALGDGYESRPPTRSETYGRVMGTVGAAGCALVGRLTLQPALGAWALGMAGSLIGPHFAVAGVVLGAIGGLTLELDRGLKGLFPLGRIVGGAIGGLIGYGTGRVLGAMRMPLPFPSGLVQTTAGFTPGKLLKNIRNVHYTSHKKLPQQCFDEVMPLLRKGDVLLSTKDGTPDLAVSLLTVGGPGNGAWLHGAIYAGNGHTIEANDGGVIMRPMRSMVAESHHLMVRRPHYAPGQADAVVNSAMSHLGTPFGFNGSLSETEFYCTDLVYHSLKDGAPQVHLQQHKRFNMRFVIGDDVARCKDMDTVYSTGSNIVTNYLAKFC
jgi:hypothetical protein